MFKFLRSIFLTPKCPLQQGDRIKLNLGHKIYNFEPNKVYTADVFYLSDKKDRWFVRVKEVGGSTLCSDFDKVV